VEEKVGGMVMGYERFLEFMTIVQEKNMGLRDWSSHEGLRGREYRGRPGVPPDRAKEQRPKIMQKNAVFDYQVKSAIGMVDKLFARGAELSEFVRFPELKVQGEVVENEIEEDWLERWERFK
jgi:hypothetical protein